MDQGGETVFVPVCRKFKKPGQCPRLEQQSTSCEVECHDDADCRGDYKCCSAGCSNVCHSPMDERTRATTQAVHHQESKPSGLEEVSEEDLRPVAREGGVATLRCFATGFPPPSITWKRGGIEVRKRQTLTKQKHSSETFFFSAQNESRSFRSFIWGRSSNCTITSDRCRNLCMRCL